MGTTYKRSALSYVVAVIAALITLIGFHNVNMPSPVKGALSLNHRAARLVRSMIRSELATPSYSVQIFSHDPLVMVIDSFVSGDEIEHLLTANDHKFQESRVYAGYDEGIVDTEKRISESAKLNSSDPIVKRIQQRAHSIVGWRGASVTPQALTLQRYKVDGFYDYHYDWDPTLTHGNRVSTFMVYAKADCEGGGTNFPYLPRPNDTRWCDMIECTEEGIDGFQGTTFKPRPGSAIFWENFHPNGTGHENVYHAGLPVKSGLKIGLNIWFWDSEWRAPSDETA